MIKEFYEFFSGGCIGLLAWFFGGLDGSIQVLLAFSVIDYFTGISASIVQKQKLSSEVGFKGIARKVTMFAFVGIAHIVDKYLLGDSIALRTAVCLFYIGNEGISILENAHNMNLPIPKFLEDKFLHFTEHFNERDKK